MLKDEPAVHHRTLTLGYNVLNVGQVDNNKLGSICVTVIFRPVPAVAKSGWFNTFSLSCEFLKLRFQHLFYGTSAQS